MTLKKTGDCDMVSYNHKYYFRLSFGVGEYFWYKRYIGSCNLMRVEDPEEHRLVEQLYEDTILDTGGVVEDPDEKFIMKQKEEYPYKKYTPEETEKSLKDAMKTAKAQGVFDEPKPETLTLKQLLKKWEFDFSAKWAKNMITSELYDEEVERFIQMFIEWMPDAVDDVCDWSSGYNECRDTVMEKLK